MENYLEKIKIKLKKNIKIEEIDIVDNSHLHSKHKFFDKNKKHLKIIVKSNFLKDPPPETTNPTIAERTRASAAPQTQRPSA